MKWYQRNAILSTRTNIVTRMLICFMIILDLLSRVFCMYCLCSINDIENNKSAVTCLNAIEMSEWLFTLKNRFAYILALDIRTYHVYIWNHYYFLYICIVNLYFQISASYFDKYIYILIYFISFKIKIICFSCSHSIESVLFTNNQNFVMEIFFFSIYCNWT